MYNVSVSPHIRNDLTTQKVMRDVMLAFLPTALIGIWVHGFQAFLVMVLAILTAVISEAVFNLITHKGKTIHDTSAAVTGLLLALTLPANVPLYIPVLGSIFAIIVVKCLFGGLGHNIVNPALAGRCFLLISFGAVMTSYTLDGVTAATPLAQLANNEAIDIIGLAIGRSSGVIGASAAGLFAGGIYLLLKKGITYEIPVSMIVAFVLFIAIFGGHGFSAAYIVPQVLGGGLLMAAFFMSTDPVTCPSTTKGQLVYGAVTGILIALFRVKGTAADSTTYAVLLANLFSNLIDELFIPTPFGYRIQKSKKEAAIPKPVIILAVITLVAGAALSGVYVMTKDRIAANQEMANQEAYLQVCPDAASFAHDKKIDAVIAEMDGAVYGSSFGNSIIDDVIVGEDKAGNVVGYVISVTSKDAFDGSMSFVVGLKVDGTINCISFTELNETAGMGMLVKEDAFRTQFDGVKVSSFTLNKSGSSDAVDVIDSVSGASKSSGAVVNAVNAVLDFFAKNIQ